VIFINLTWTNEPRVGGDVIVTEPLRDKAGNIVRNKDGRPLYRTLRGPTSLMGAGELLLMPRAEPERVPREVDNRLNMIERILEELRSKPFEESNIVTVTEPIRNEQGRLITSEDGKPISKIVKGPAKQTKSKAELTPEDIRKMIRDEVRPREASPKETVSKDDLERFKRDTVESVKKLFEERETESCLARIEKDLKDIKTGAAGHMSEEGRIKLTGN